MYLFIDSADCILRRLLYSVILRRHANLDVNSLVVLHIYVYSSDILLDTLHMHQPKGNCFDKTNQTLFKSAPLQSIVFIAASYRHRIRYTKKCVYWLKGLLPVSGEMESIHRGNVLRLQLLESVIKKSSSAEWFTKDVIFKLHLNACNHMGGYII